MEEDRTENARQRGTGDTRRVGLQVRTLLFLSVITALLCRYFGAARDLPGVRELFEPAPIDTSHKTRAELMKCIDADYYGCVVWDSFVLVAVTHDLSF